MVVSCYAFSTIEFISIATRNLDSEMMHNAKVNYAGDLADDILVQVDQSVFASNGAKGWIVTNDMQITSHREDGAVYDLLDLDESTRTEVIGYNDADEMKLFIQTVKKYCV